MDRTGLASASSSLQPHGGTNGEVWTPIHLPSLELPALDALPIMTDCPAFLAWVASTMEDVKFAMFTRDLLQAASGPRLPDVVFRDVIATLAKRHGLTRTCAALERSLYSRGP